SGTKSLNEKSLSIRYTELEEETKKSKGSLSGRRKQRSLKVCFTPQTCFESLRKKDVKEENNRIEALRKQLAQAEMDSSAKIVLSNPETQFRTLLSPELPEKGHSE
ncbi:hypothetical protein ACH5RR_029612, partial [Cinchona calisaya]